MKLSAKEVARLTEGELLSGVDDAEIGGVSIDSRTVSAGELFIAIRGPHHDGHRFVASALERGASGVVVSEPPADIVPGDIPVELARAFVVRVADTSKALQELAHGVRRSSSARIVAITGSMGKTTTKDAAATAIGSAYSVLKSEGNFNNLFGLPLSLLKLRDEDVAVLEMGMSEPGEIARLTEIAEPDVGVLTNVDAVHLEFFPSVTAIAEAKGELLVGLAENAVAVVNADDPLVLEQARKFAGMKLSFGIDASADLEARDIRTTAAGLRFLAREGERSVEVASPLHGRHNIYNLLAGLAAARALDVPLDRAAAALHTLAPARHRGERLLLPAGVLVIDETYNSSPRALACAIAALTEEDGARHVAVVGDMLELGPQAEAFHREIGRDVAARRLGLVVGVGSLGRIIVDAAREAGMAGANLLAYADAAEVGRDLAAHLRENDVVLFKASRGIGLESAIETVRKKMEETH